ncbi:MAG: sialidase family protein [Verrucomicrobiota bacterium]|jgi:hypothetical protein
MKILLTTVAAVCGLSLVVDPGLAQTWTQTSAPTNYWQSIASSADGSKLVAAVSYTSAGSGIYTSTNSGATWALNNLPIGPPYGGSWESVASSADGSKLVAAAFEYGIFISTNSGVDWIQTSAPTNSQAPKDSNGLWGSVASSADGSILVASVGQAFNYVGPIYVSTNSGATWTQTSAPTNNWVCVASSADGRKLVAAVCYGRVYTSADTGVTWTQTSLPYTNWISVASSADGDKLVAANAYPFSGVSSLSCIYSSIDSGVTWTAHIPPFNRTSWQEVVSSADGMKLVAVAQDPDAYEFSIYTSTDLGTTWMSNNAPFQVYCCVASSADGGKLVAGSVGDPYNPQGGGIYTLQTTPAPQLNLAPSGSNLTVSWIIPSTNFVLQQSSYLTSWADVTNPPTFDLTNLQDEVVLSPTNSSSFYRLKTP